MKKFLFVVALSLAFGGIGHAEQIDKGQSLSTAPKKFFVGRYARTGAIATAGGQEISKDSVVVWDTTSRDGVSILTTTTSGDSTVAGIAMDRIPGSSRDNTAAQDENQNNWGRIKVWGLHEDARVASVATIKTGDKLCTSGTAQALSRCVTTSGDQVGVALSDEAGDLVDLMVYKD